MSLATPTSQLPQATPTSNIDFSSLRRRAPESDSFTLHPPILPSPTSHSHTTTTVTRGTLLTTTTTKPHPPPQSTPPQADCWGFSHSPILPNRSGTGTTGVRKSSQALLEWDVGGDSDSNKSAFPEFAPPTTISESHSRNQENDDDVFVRGIASSPGVRRNDHRVLGPGRGRSYSAGVTSQARGFNSRCGYLASQAHAESGWSLLKMGGVSRGSPPRHRTSCECACVYVVCMCVYMLTMCEYNNYYNDCVFKLLDNLGKLKVVVYVVLLLNRENVSLGW